MKSDKFTPSYANYNVRVRCTFDSPLNDYVQWVKQQGFPLKVFENYDGGGYNFHIFEFQEIAHARVFMLAFDIRGARKLWGEDSQRRIHYLDEDAV